MKPKHCTLAAGALIVALLASCATGGNPSEGNGRPTGAMAISTELFDTGAAVVYEAVPYATTSPSQVCDIYLPEGTGPFPVIVLVHGGGFAFQNQRMARIEPVAAAAIARGYAVVSIDYRKSDEANFPGSLADTKAAVRFVRAQADTYGFDTSKIVTWGESAGAYLALMTALTPEVPALDGDVTDNAGVSSAVDAFVDFYGPVEFSTMDAEFQALGKDGTSYGTENSFESRYLGFALSSDKEATYRSYWETYRDQVPSAVKAWIQAGTADGSVPPTQSANLAERLSALIGADQVHYGTIEGAQHMDDAFYTDENLADVFAFLATV